MDFEPDVQYLVDRSVRRGNATWEEIERVGCEQGLAVADAVAERLHAAGVRLIRDSDLEITSQTNVLMNDLTLVELVSLSLQLPAVPQTRRRLYRRVLGQRSYERDLKRLEYLDDDYEWYYLAPAFNRLQRSIRRLFKSGEIPFARGWQEGDRRTNLKYLKGLVAHPAFAAQIVPAVRDHYRQLKPVRRLLNWIQATGQTAPTMADVIRAGLERDGEVAVRQTLLSDSPSTAGGALESRRDVCFSCAAHRRCHPLRGVTNVYAVLREYRTMSLDRLLANRHPGKSLTEAMTEDGLITKFYLPYSIVVSAKNWLLEMEVISRSSGVLDKSHGRYCPQDDTWGLCC